MIPLFVLSLLVPWAIGFAWVQLFWPERQLVSPDLPLKVILGWGFGIGMSSCLYFLERLLGWTARSEMIGMETALLLVLLGLLALRAKRGRSAQIAPRQAQGPKRKGKVYWILLVVFGAELIAAVAAFLLMSLQSPHGYWDAWAIWNLRARFLFRGGAYWRDGFSPLLAATHPDYPPLLPSLIARCWGFIGRETVAVPIVIAMGFTLAGAGLAWASLVRLRSRSQGLLAGIVLLGAPYFVELGAIQYADIPLAFFMLATLVLLCLQDRSSGPSQGLTFLAGTATGFCMLMKNEGLLFGLVVLAVQAAVLAPGRGWKAGLRQMLLFLSGLAPLAVLLLYFKTKVAPPSEMVTALWSPSTAAKLLDASRYVQTIKAFAAGLVKFGQWIIPALPILILYLIALGVHAGEKDKRSVAAVMIALCLTGAGYFFTYIVTPYDLRWHLTNSLSRLFMHLWPGFVFLFFLLAKTPEEALASPVRAGGQPIAG